MTEKKWIPVVLITLGFWSILPGAAFCESYPNGAEGIKAATLPHPGFYHKMYNAYLTSNQMVDDKGDEAPVDFEAKIFANVHRFLWVSNIEVLEGNYAADIVIPLSYKNIQLGVMDYDESRWSLGDIFVEPFAVTWHGLSYDAGTSIGFFMPTGNYEDPVDSGEGMWTTMFTLGGTYYFDAAKLLSASVLSRHEIHSKKRQIDITPGDDFHFEWGVGKTVDRIWDIGIAGYCQWQVKRDRSSGASKGKDRAYGIGPEVSLFFQPSKIKFSLRYEYDFLVKGRTSGRPAFSRAFLIISKIF